MNFSSAQPTKGKTLNKFIFIVFAGLLSFAGLVQAQSSEALYFTQGGKGDLVQVDCIPRDAALASIWAQRCNEIEQALTKLSFTKVRRGANSWAELERDKGPAGCSVMFMITTKRRLETPVVCYYGSQERVMALRAKVRLAVNP